MMAFARRRFFKPRSEGRPGHAAGGFTLVELLIALALSVLVSGTLYLVQSTGLSQVSKGTTRLTLQSEMRRKLERMVQDLRAANEVLEVSPNAIKISQYKTTAEDNAAPTIHLQTISYFVEKDGNNHYVLKRSENREQAQEIFSADHIEDGLFIPFYEDVPSQEHDYPIFKKYDMKANDSGWRKFISFIRIHLKARQNKEFITLVTAATLRMAHQRLLQPHWKPR